jgi:secreted trypsin-like serine protease
MGCGGSLVAKDMVLTAAHCIDAMGEDPLPNSISVTIMRRALNSTDGEEIKSKEIIKHPQWDSDKIDFDYALLVLDRATTQDVKLIKLNSDPNFPPPDSPSRVMGWGKTETGNGSNVPFEVDVNVISNVECDTFWGGEGRIHNVHICTLEQSKSFCQGDSGEIELS